MDIQIQLLPIIFIMSFAVDIQIHSKTQWQCISRFKIIADALIQPKIIGNQLQCFSNIEKLLALHFHSKDYIVYRVIFLCIHCIVFCMYL